MSRRYALPLLGSLLALAVTASATVPTTRTPEVTTPTVSTGAAHAHWGMTAEEWSRYLEVMEGPAAYRHADRSPLTIMTLYSEGEEQRRWAERLVAHEYAENAREIRANRAFHEAAMRLYPPRQTAAQTTDAPLPTRLAERYLLFVADECPACDRLLQRAIALAEQRRVDIYLIGADSTRAVSEWALRKGVPRHLVPARLTINLDGGTFARLNRLAHEVPALYAVDDRRMAHAVPDHAVETLFGALPTSLEGAR